MTDSTIRLIKMMVNHIKSILKSMTIHGIWMNNIITILRMPMAEMIFLRKLTEMKTKTRQSVKKM
jgi:hypothetical protein